MDEDSDKEDYLQDPELWGARLPQPYRMIDKILNQLLEETWEHIEHREVLTQQEEASVKVPEGTGGRAVCGNVLTKTRAGVCSGKDVLFIGNGKSVCVVGVDSAKVGVIAQCDLQYEVIGLEVVQRNEVYIIVVQHNTEIKILGYLRNIFVEVADLHSQSKDNINNIVEMTVSSSCSHVSVTWHSSQPAETKLSVYVLPVESWLSELPVATPVGSQVSIASQKDVTYSKTVLLYTLPAPYLPTPSTASHPHSIFQSVCDQAGEIVPSGELHSLTKSYFENRRRLYALKRQPFVKSSSSIAAGSLNQHPTPHFIHYKSNRRQIAACEVAVLWEGHSHLTLYPLEEANAKSNTVHPTRIPQASSITCSSISKDSSMLAMGLQTGTVVVWDMRLGLCSRVVSCVVAPDVVAVLKFFPHAGDLMVAIGTDKGKVLALDTAMNSNTPAVALNSRIKNQQEVYGALFDSSGYDVQSKVVCIVTNSHLPSLLTSVHANGALVVWNVSECEAICRFTLDKSWSLSSPTYSCVMSDNGHQLLMTGKLVDSDTDCYNVVSFDLHSEECLDGYWEASSDSFTDQQEAIVPEEHGNYVLLDLAEIHLRDYVKARLSEMDENLMKWQEHWKDLPNRLTEQS